MTGEPDLFANLETLTQSYSEYLRAAMVRAGFADLTLPMMRLLNRINDGVDTVRDLAADLPVTQQAVSKSTTALGGGGYLQQERAHHDRRNNHLHLTERGAQALRAERQARRHLSTIVVADLGPGIASALRAAVADLPTRPD